MKLSPDGLFAAVQGLVLRARLSAVAAAAGLMLAACGGGGDASNPTTTSESVQGTVSGLTADGLVLSNGSDSVTVAANAASFSVPVGGTLSVARQPLGFTQACEVTGTASAPVVSCAAAAVKVSRLGGFGMPIAGGDWYNRLVAMAPDGSLVIVANQRVGTLSATQGYGFLAGAANPPISGPAPQTGTGVNVYFGDIVDITVDAQGITYVMDQTNSKLLKVTRAGVVTEVTFPFFDTANARNNKLAADAAGNIYVSEQGYGQGGRITRVDAQGNATLVFNGATIDIGGDKITVDQLAVRPDGQAYFYSGVGGAVYRVDGIGQATLVAGSGDGTSGNQLGSGTGVLLSGVSALAADASGVLYVADQNGRVVRRVDTAGTVTAVAGRANSASEVDGTGTQAEFGYIGKLTLDAAGTSLYAATTSYGLRKVSSLAVNNGGVVGTIASRDLFVPGPKGLAALVEPNAVVEGPDGTVYIADRNLGAVRKLLRDGTVVNLAGPTTPPQGPWPARTDGPGDQATFSSNIRALAVDANNNVYVADAGDCAVRKISPSRVVSTLVGANGCGYVNGGPSVAKLGEVRGVAVDAQGNVYVTESDSALVRKILPDGTVSVLAGSYRSFGVVDGNGASANFDGPWGLAIDAAGNLYVTENYASVVRKVTPSGAVTTVAGVSGSNGSADGPALSATFNSPRGIAVDAAGNVYIADTDNSLVRQLRPDGTVRTLVGQFNTYEAVDGVDARASFGYVESLWVTASGALLVGDTDARAVRRIEAIKP